MVVLSTKLGKQTQITLTHETIFSMTLESIRLSIIFVLLYHNKTKSSCQGRLEPGTLVSLDCGAFTYSELGMQPVRAADDVAELLSCQQSAGRQQVLPGHCFSGGYHGNVEGLHGAESRHVQHQRDIRAPSGGQGRGYCSLLIVFMYNHLVLHVPALLKFRKTEQNTS